jgi:hypothetical protein
VSDACQRVLFSVAGFFLGLLARLWLATLRVRVVADPALAERGEHPWVFAFWHGTQWPLLAWRRRKPTVVMVSHSRDGAMQARALRLQGLRVVRGSSSRGGARGLAALVRRMRKGADAAFAVDGPRGPHGSVKGGAVVAARAAGGMLVPMGAGVTRGIVLRKTWDKFQIAWPFSRVTVALGEPIDPSLPDAKRRLEAAIARVNELAGNSVTIGK